MSLLIIGPFFSFFYYKYYFFFLFLFNYQRTGGIDSGIFLLESCQARNAAAGLDSLVNATHIHNGHAPVLTKASLKSDSPYPLFPLHGYRLV